MQRADRFPRGEPDLRKVWKEAKKGDGGDIHRVHHDRPDEGLEVRLDPEEVTEIKVPIPTPQTDTRDHETECTRAEFMT